MVDDNSIVIKAGRHLLQELVTQSFVPNDWPNHSGKSIYLKQVALITYLAHIGSYVPATSATIGITDKILTRLPTQESSTVNESSFAIDLRQVNQVICHQTSRSLIIVDEFGKGTNNDDGAGLMSALLVFLQRLGNRAPRSILATHYHDALTCPVVHPSRLKLAHMQVVPRDSTEDPLGCLTYLFSLQTGPCTLSFGTYCASVNGMPNAVVERSRQIFSQLSANRPASSLDLSMTEEYECRLKVAETVARQFLAINFDLESILVVDDLSRFWEILT
ncbi:hypothetical protein VHEMI06009 [[Torrubiella] hemipterigena]|uniref:DNA mismatch repair proteins mutS family domain-containing protein n=1 Tax=[Torrubiella] hemipterigena TaxID=1531966 RepID=A0A0A1SZI5_9HYPO|nr:hypothetical protein VHEMI06009 [[Torrubiella] hemipterigena]